MRDSVGRRRVALSAATVRRRHDRRRVTRLRNYRDSSPPSSLPLPSHPRILPPITSLPGGRKQFFTRLDRSTTTVHTGHSGSSHGTGTDNAARTIVAADLTRSTRPSHSPLFGLLTRLTFDGETERPVFPIFFRKTACVLFPSPDRPIPSDGSQGRDEAVAVQRQRPQFRGRGRTDIQLPELGEYPTLLLINTNRIFTLLVLNRGRIRSPGYRTGPSSLRAIFDM